jgi:sugar phosphate isomerase/epimerase
MPSRQPISPNYVTAPRLAIASARAYNGPMFTRRELLQSAPLVAACSAGRLAAAQLQSIGVQLYTVRSVLPQKPAETLRAIEAIGYREIEATYGGLDKIWPDIAATHLKPVSIHLDNTLMNAGKEDDLSRAIDQAKKWGFAYAVFPYVPPSERGGLDKFRALTAKLNHAGEKCRAAGLRFAYHNHAFEFEPMEGTTGFQVMMDGLDKNLCGFELDVFWVSVAGHNPVELLQQLSGRVPLVHLKDKAPGTPVMYKESVDRGAFKEVGHGTLAWPNILRAAASAGVEHYFVEQDQTPGDPIESLKQSYQYLSKLQY